MRDEVPAEWSSYSALNEKFFETFVKPEESGEVSGEAGEGAKKDKRQGIPEEFVQLPDVPGPSIRPLLRPFVMHSQL